MWIKKCACHKDCSFSLFTFSLVQSDFGHYKAFTPARCSTPWLGQEGRQNRSPRGQELGGAQEMQHSRYPEPAPPGRWGTHTGCSTWEACDVNNPSWASHLSEISLQLEYSGPTLVFLSKEPSWGERRGRSAGGGQGARQG